MRNWEIDWRGCVRNKLQGKVGKELDVVVCSLVWIVWRCGEAEMELRPAARRPATNPEAVDGSRLGVRAGVDRQGLDDIRGTNKTMGPSGGWLHIVTGGRHGIDQEPRNNYTFRSLVRSDSYLV